MKRKNSKSVVAQFLFWFHIFLIVCGVLLGFVLPPLYMFIFILLHQLHVQLLGGCALTILQKKVRAIPQKQDFFQYLVYRLFSLKINTFQGSLINYLVLVLAFSISLFHFGW